MFSYINSDICNALIRDFIGSVALYQLFKTLKLLVK